MPRASPEGALDAWARYVEAHPFAWKLLFRETTGDPDAEAAYREVQGGARAALSTVLGADEASVELVRSGLTGLALWWQEHPDVPREQIVATAMNVLWIGFDRLVRGARWTA